jgi:hypothetical protein
VLALSLNPNRPLFLQVISPSDSVMADEKVLGIERKVAAGKSDRSRGIERKMRRNLLLSMEFYDEATDEMEWSAHSYIFDKAPAAAPAPPATGRCLQPVPFPL